MMHYEQYVVAITDSRGKSFREFDSERLSNGRKSKIYLPFDSEYAIKVKNNSDRRIKISIDIDGTNVSGNGLILKSYETDSIERFVDVAKKFKFVKKNDERVSDPTNRDNGVLKVKIEKEVSVHRLNDPITWPNGTSWITTTSYHYSLPIVQQYNTWGQPMIGGVSPQGYGHNSGDVHYTARNASCEYSCSSIPVAKSLRTKSLLNEEVGATIEGSLSQQHFDTTVWLGTEGDSYEFIFKLLGQNGISDLDRLEYQKFLELKKKFEG